MQALLPVAADRPFAIIQAIGAIIILADGTAGAEIGAAGQTGGDDATGGQTVEARLGGGNELRLAIAGDKARVLHQMHAVAAPRARCADDAVAAQIVPAQQQVTATACELHAAGQADAVILVVAIGGLAITDIALEAGERLVEDEVDDTSNSVRAIDRRGAAGDDLDALHKPLWDGVDVYSADAGRADRASAIEQDQGAVGAQAPQVERVDARRAGAQEALAVRRSLASDH